MYEYLNNISEYVVILVESTAREDVEATYVYANCSLSGLMSAVSNEIQLCLNPNVQTQKCNQISNEKIREKNTIQSCIFACCYVL